MKLILKKYNDSGQIKTDAEGGKNRGSMRGVCLLARVAGLDSADFLGAFYFLYGLGAYFVCSPLDFYAEVGKNAGRF